MTNLGPYIFNIIFAIYFLVNLDTHHAKSLINMVENDQLRALLFSYIHFSFFISEAARYFEISV